MGDNYNHNEQENKDLVKELEQIKKRQKFLKIMTYILLFIVIASFSVFYIIYSNYKKIQNSIESAIENPQMQEKLNDFASKMVEYSSAIVVSTVNQPSSLSMIVFSSRSFDMSEDKKKEIENLASEVENDPELNKFIDTFKNEPEFKEILESNPKDRPAKFMQKMKDPKFMKKITNIMLSHPEIIQSLMKMTTDPRMQNFIKTAPQELEKIKQQNSEKK